MVGHNSRVKGEDCVGVTWLWLVVVDRFCPSLAQQSDQGVMLLLRYSQVRSASIVPRYWIIYRESLVRTLHQHGTQRRDHALGAVMPHY